MSLAKWDHTVKSSEHAPLNLRWRQELDLPAPEGWKAELGNRLHTEMVYPPTDSHPSKY